MLNYDNICLGCMNKKNPGEQKCPRCGYVLGDGHSLPALAPGTMLASRYLVGKRLGSNGEGIRYIGLDGKRGQRVLICEYMPSNLCRRIKGSDSVVVNNGCDAAYDDYLADFLDVSRAVAQLSGKYPIRAAIDIFECNNTAYAIYEYIPGRPLSELIQRLDRLSWDECRQLFAPILDTMIAAHSLGLVHFGLSPETIVMTKDGNLMITGFGVPDARLRETDLKPELFDGFAALEQYSLDLKKGKWTDVYALSAVIFFCLTGKRPPDAQSRNYEPRLSVPSSLASAIPTHVVAALAGGLQVHAEKRTRSMEQLKSELLQKSAASSGVRQASPPSAKNPQQPQRPQQPQKQYAPPARENPPQKSSPAAAASEARHSTAQSSSLHPQKTQAQPTQRPGGMLEKLDAGVVGGINDIAGKLRSSTPAKKKPQTDDDEPWFTKLTQFQYGLIALLGTVVVLGTIALVVFFSVRDSLGGEVRTGTNVIDLGDADGSGSSGVNEATIEVPDFVGSYYSTLKSNPDYLMFTFVVLDEQYSNSYEEGAVIRQSIEKGTLVPENSVIALTVSLGSERVQIPNIEGKTIAMADIALTEAGLSLGSQSEEYSSSVGVGRIISISGYSAGDWVKRGTKINVVVSLGEE